MVREARGVIADLRPTALDDFGVTTALRAPVDALCADGWEASYAETLGAERLPPVVETALFRVAQEALALGNVRKHAGGTRVHVALLRQERTIRLEIQDWGRGFLAVHRAGGAGPASGSGCSACANGLPCSVVAASSAARWGPGHGFSWRRPCRR